MVLDKANSSPVAFDKFVIRLIWMLLLKLYKSLISVGIFELPVVKQQATVSPQPGPGIGIGVVGQQPICGYCSTKDFRITELEGVMKKKDHEIEQLNERIRKLEQKQSSVTFEF